MAGTANVAALRLVLDDGTDLADKINPRHLSLTLTEKRGGEADELSLTLQNHDGRLAAPETGRVLSLALGWKSGADVKPGLVDKGRFRVDEVTEGGPPDVITITARSVDLTGDYRQRRTKAWKDTTLGALLGEIARRHGVTAQVHPDLAGKPIEAIEQHGKSDMAFVKDLGSRFDAVATWKNRALIFMPVGAATTASGKAIPAITLTRRQGWTWQFTRADRDESDGAEAQWHDKATGRRRTVKSDGGKNRRKLKRVYASEAEAKHAVAGQAAKGKRGGYKFAYDLAFADMALTPNGKVTLQGWREGITSRKWLVESVETSLDAQGMKQKINLETA